MAQFTLSSHLLILVGIFSHYSLGRRLGFPELIAGTLVGVCASALAVASLANVSAGLIHGYVLFSTAFFGVLTVKDLIGSSPVHRGNAMPTIALLVTGLALFVLLNPGVRHLFTDTSGHRILRYNNHYPYFASQTIEMLRANYFSRLRFEDLYPLEWARYHFFNTATIALAEGLVPGPNLFSYFIVKAFFAVLVLLAFLECQWTFSGFSLRTAAGALLGLIFGWVVFFDVVSWNLSTSGAFSVYGAVLLVFALFYRQPERAFAYLLILTASAIRFLPIGGVALAALLFRIAGGASPRALTAALRRLNLWQYAALGLFCLYHLLTILSPGGSAESFYAPQKFSDGWMYVMFGYKVAGLSSKTLFSALSYPLFNLTGFFSRIIDSRHQTLFFLGSFLIAAAWVAASAVARSWRERGAIDRSAWVAGIAFVAVSLFSRVSSDITRLHVVLLTTLFFTMTFLYLAGDEKGERSSLLNFVFWIQMATLVYQYLGNDGIKAPVAYVMFDVVLWSAISLFLLTSLGSPHGTWLAAGVAALVFFFPAPLNRTLDITLGSFNVNALVDVTPLLEKNFVRSSFVDEKNNMVFMSPDGSVMESYTTILGARLPYSAQGHGFMNYRFMKKTDLAAAAS